jgi:hypothetical protein
MNARLPIDGAYDVSPTNFFGSKMFNSRRGKGKSKKTKTIRIMLPELQQHKPERNEN